MKDWRVWSWVVLAWPMACAAASQDDAARLDFDFSPLPLNSSQHDRIPRPIVSWEVHPEPSQRCSELAPAPRRQHYSSACATWDIKQQRCHIVTTARTTHVQLGRLLVACMRKEAS